MAYTQFTDPLSPEQFEYLMTMLQPVLTKQAGTATLGLVANMDVPSNAQAAKPKKNTSCLASKDHALCAGSAGCL